MASVPASISDIRRNLTRLHNERRAAAGVRTVLYQNNTLNSLAQNWANQMADKNYWKPDTVHTRPNGYTFAQWWDAKAPSAWCCGKTSRGENMAINYWSNAEVMNAWMNSPGHRGVILNGNHNSVGFGVADRYGKRWWVAHFVRA